MSDLKPIVKRIFGHPLFLVILIGAVIRFVLSPLSLEVDTKFWTIIVRNMDAGQGLYAMEGNYYTPVWGYIIGFISFIQSSLLDFGDVVNVCDDALFVLGYKRYGYSNILATIPFMILLKISLFISDLILSLIVYKIILERTGDMKKSVIGFALVFLAPTIIGSSSILTMSDTISAVFTVLSLYLIRRKNYCIAGICYSFAVLNKFFPIFLIFIIAAYIVSINEHDIKRSGRPLIGFTAGAIGASFMILLPQILDGTLPDCFRFITDRAAYTTNIGPLPINTVIIILLGVIGISFLVYLGYVLFKSDNNDDTMVACSLLAMSAPMFLFTNAQYFVIIIPFLAYMAVIRSRVYKYVWLSVAVSALMIIPVLNTNASMFLHLAYYTDMVDLGMILDGIEWFNSPVISGMTVADIFCATGIFIEKASLIAIAATVIGRWILSYRGVQCKIL